MTREPRIIINGYEISEAAAMTIRVAVENFAMDLQTNGLGKDETGRKITAGYLAQIEVIRYLIFERGA